MARDGDKHGEQPVRLENDAAFVDSLSLKPVDAWTGREKNRLLMLAVNATHVAVSHEVTPACENNPEDCSDGDCRMNGVCELTRARPSSTVTIDLDAEAWNLIKAAARESKWMPPEYMMNDWVSDVCRVLREGVAASAIREPDHYKRNPNAGPCKCGLKEVPAGCDGVQWY